VQDSGITYHKFSQPRKVSSAAALGMNWKAGKVSFILIDVTGNLKLL
jgi:hypothetical protein